MCGIIYASRFGDKPVAKKIRKQYEQQQARGKEGFGYVAVKNGIVTDYQRDTGEKAIMAKMRIDSANEIMFHHRFPTSTPNFEEAAHPIFVSNPLLRYDYYVVHNGVITNDDELKEKHEKLGYLYTTELKQQWVSRHREIVEETTKFNDSESLAIELARDLDGEKKGLQNVRGSIAFVCMQVNKSTKEVVRTYFGRNSSNPLKYNLVFNAYILVSSLGEGKECIADYLYTVNYETGNIEQKYYCIGTGYYYKGQNSFKDRDEDDWNPAGFLTSPKTMSDDEKNKQEEQDKKDEVYLELLDEYYDLEGQVANPELSELEEIQMRDRMTEVMKQITDMDTDYLQKKLV